MPIREPMTPALLADPTVFQLHRLPPHAALELERPRCAALPGPVRRVGFPLCGDPVRPFLCVGKADRSGLYPDAEPASARGVRMAPPTM